MASETEPQPSTSSMLDGEVNLTVSDSKTKHETDNDNATFDWAIQMRIV